MRSANYDRQDHDPNIIYKLDDYGTPKFHDLIDKRRPEEFTVDSESQAVASSTNDTDAKEVNQILNRRVTRRGFLAGAAIVATAGSTSMAVHEIGLLGNEKTPEPKKFIVPYDNPSLDTVREIVAHVYPNELDTEDKITEYIASGAIVIVPAAEGSEQHTSYDNIWGGDTLILPHP